MQASIKQNRTGQELLDTFARLVESGDPEVQQFLRDNPPTDDENYNGSLQAIAILIGEGVLAYNTKTQTLRKRARA